MSQMHSYKQFIMLNDIHPHDFFLKVKVKEKHNLNSMVLSNAALQRCNVASCEHEIFQYGRCYEHYYLLCRYKPWEKKFCECPQVVGDSIACLEHRYQYVKQKLLFKRRVFPCNSKKRYCIIGNCNRETYFGQPICPKHDSLYCKGYNIKGDPNSRCLHRVKPLGPKKCVVHLTYQKCKECEERSVRKGLCQRHCDLYGVNTAHL